jgi:histidine ammonia-lyase
MREVVIDGRTLSPSDLAAVASGAPVRLDDQARSRMESSARAVKPGAIRRKWQWLVGGEPPESDADLAQSFIEGHCAGVGRNLNRGVVRALIAARLNVIATGYSGCRPAVAETLLTMLRADVVPLVPAKGSVGAAGVAQLAHIARVACGYGGEAWRRGRLMSAADAMRDLPVLEPTEKEALALVNGATLTAAEAAIAVVRARILLETAEAACALSFEVIRADLTCLSPRAMEVRNHPGPIAVAQRLRRRLAGSELVWEGRRTDAFSVRCAPAVLGAAWDALEFVEKVVTRELNGACDNPLVLPRVGVVEAGNFHAAPVALAMDHLKIALTQVASIAERRVFRLNSGQLSGLPSFLLPGTGLNSGLMLAQYTAASLVSECKGLAHPASVDSIPTVQHREDHVSMGPIAARGALRICDRLADVLAIELLCAAQGLDFRMSGDAVDEHGQLTKVPKRRPGGGDLATWKTVREHVTKWEDDRVMRPDLIALGTAVRGAVFAETELIWV